MVSGIVVKIEDKSLLLNSKKVLIMKSLVEYINEGNISNTERKYREFTQMCLGYNIDLGNLSVKKTSKNNWAVYDGDKRKFTASSNILDDSVVEKFGIKLKED